MRIHDLSRPLRADLAVWPGDPRVAFALRARREGDAGSNVGHLALCLHAGTLVDAFFHYDNAGATVDALDPALFVGPAAVLDVRAAVAPDPSGRRPDVSVDAVRAALATLAIGDGDAVPPRVLLRTDAWLDDATFPHDFPGLEPAVPTWLAARGVTLLGVDVPSVDALATPGLPAHLACGAARVTILESLDLSDVRAGASYELIALPLRIAGADGSPVRAVLIARSGNGRVEGCE